MKTKVVLSMFLFAIIFALAPGLVKAIEYGQMGGSPTNFDPNVPDSKSWFIYKLDPGTTKEDSLTVVNLFEDSWTAVIYAADSLKSSSGGFALRQLTEPKEAVGSWVKFYPDTKPDFAGKIFEDKKTIDEVCKVSDDDLKNKYELSEDNISELKKWCEGKELVEMDLKSGEKRELLFVISIPKDADVGEHTGGILIQKKNKDETAQSDGSKVMLTTRVGVRIYETVPGDINKTLAFSNLKIAKNFDEFYLPWDKDKKDKFKEYLITSDIKNNGNISVDFSEKITIANVITRKTENIENRNFQVLRGDNFVSTLSWKSPRFGLLSFQKEYRYANANGEEQIVQSELIKKWFIPWRELVIFTFFVLVATGVYAFWKKYQRKYYGGIGWINYQVGEGETVQSLIKKFSVDWNVFVKTNKLKKPYLLEAGQMIRVPKNNSGDLPEEDFFLKEEINPIKNSPEKIILTPKSLTDGVANKDELSDEDILNRKDLFDDSPEKENIKDELVEIVDIKKDTKDTLMKNDIVDSSLFFASDASKKEESLEVIKEEEVLPVAKTKKTIVNAQPLRKNADIRKPQATIVEDVESDFKSIKESVPEKNDDLIIEDGAATVLGNKDDSKSYFKLVIIALASVIIILLGTVIYLLINNKAAEKTVIQSAPANSESNQGSAPSENVAVEENKEEATEEELLDPLKMTIEVYNASGVVGAAGKVKDFLVSKKYESVEAKNYPGDEVTGSTIYYKEERMKEEAQWLADMLKDSDIDAQVKLATTEEEKSADVVIILGK